jgi:hypothetical protein
MSPPNLRRVDLMAGCLLLAGCASGPAGNEPAAPAPEPVGSPTAPPAEGEGRGPAITYRPVRNAAYAMVRHDSLSLQYPDGATQTQVRDRTAYLHLTVGEAGAPDAYSVIIVLDSLEAVENGAPVPLDSVATSRGTRWTGTLTRSGELSALTADRSSTLGDEVGSRLRLLFPSLPAGGAREGLTWTDTTQYQVVADAFQGSEQAVITYRATEPASESSGSQKVIALQGAGSYTRSGTRLQADQELQMTASGSRQSLHRLGLDGVLISGQGKEAGKMEISVPALGQTVPVVQAGSWMLSRRL